MKKHYLFWTYFLMITANILVMVLARKLTDERLWTQWVLIIPVAMGYFAGLFAEKENTKLKAEEK